MTPDQVPIELVYAATTAIPEKDYPGEETLRRAIAAVLPRAEEMIRKHYAATVVPCECGCPSPMERAEDARKESA